MCDNLSLQPPSEKKLFSTKIHCLYQWIPKTRKASRHNFISFCESAWRLQRQMELSVNTVEINWATPWQQKLVSSEQLGCVPFGHFRDLEMWLSITVPVVSVQGDTYRTWWSKWTVRKNNVVVWPSFQFLSVSTVRTSICQLLLSRECSSAKLGMRCMTNGHSLNVFVFLGGLKFQLVLRVPISVVCAMALFADRKLRPVTSLGRTELNKWKILVCFVSKSNFARL